MIKEKIAMRRKARKQTEAISTTLRMKIALLEHTLRRNVKMSLMNSFWYVRFSFFLRNEGESFA